MEEAQRRIQRWIEKGRTRVPLNLSHLRLTDIPSIPESVKYLRCNFTCITRIDTFPPNLEAFDCIGTPIRHVAKLPDSLRYIRCSG